MTWGYASPLRDRCTARAVCLYRSRMRTFLLRRNTEWKLLKSISGLLCHPNPNLGWTTFELAHFNSCIVEFLEFKKKLKATHYTKLQVRNIQNYYVLPKRKHLRRNWNDQLKTVTLLTDRQIYLVLFRNAEYEKRQSYHNVLAYWRLMSGIKIPKDNGTNSSSGNNYDNVHQIFVDEQACHHFSLYFLDSVKWHI